MVYIVKSPILDPNWRDFLVCFQALGTNLRAMVEEWRSRDLSVTWWVHIPKRPLILFYCWLVIVAAFLPIFSQGRLLWKFVLPHAARRWGPIRKHCRRLPSGDKTYITRRSHIHNNRIHNRAQHFYQAGAARGEPPQANCLIKFKTRV